jgi:cell division protein FtsN
VQVGAFATEEDALRQVETIAQVTGTRAKVQAPGKGAERPLYRVRIGPMPRGQDLTELVDALKANGISSTVVRAPGADAPH